MNRHYDKDACANAWYILRKFAPVLRTAAPQEIVDGVTRLFDGIKEAWELDDGELKNNTERYGEFYGALLRHTELRVSDDASDQESQHYYSRNHCKALQCLVERFEDLHNNIIGNPAEDIHLRDFKKSLEA
ncbi:hypothetical protein Hte_007773 [Hypoxylon texense]